MDQNMTPEIDYSVCNNCGNCIKACKYNVLKMREWEDGQVKVYVDLPENCTGCGECAENCPLGCIWIN
ncbi:4Fe-4S dicluster domain-containing protein [Patescibacteria group bacterium]|nr:MAG: 4Fe-4S dicluster domain-containing protein [Patescibacteria group bacterium]